MVQTVASFFNIVLPEAHLAHRLNKNAQLSAFRHARKLFLSHLQQKRSEHPGHGLMLPMSLRREQQLTQRSFFVLTETKVMECTDAAEASATAAVAGRPFDLPAFFFDFFPIASSRWDEDSNLISKKPSSIGQFETK